MAVIVAIVVIALIGMGAMAVDIGRVAAEKAQLQNGADASALAIANYCVKNAASCQSTGPSLATQYTPANSNDSTAVVQSVTFPTASTVTVGTSTPASGLSLGFAHALGFSSEQVQAGATATWGPPGKGSGFPFAFSSACYDISPTTSAGQPQQFSYKPGMYCTGPSGLQIPGGWGWLDNTNCQTSTVAGQTSIGSDPGNNLPSGCLAILQTWVDTINAGGEADVVFPIFDTVTGTGTNASYHITGYATFKMIGWKLVANNSAPGSFRNTAAALTSLGISSSLACSGGTDRCVIAQFIRFDLSDPSFVIGNGQNYGSEIVSLIN
ncbi:Tad domain-containing protein [Sinomonas sp. JGH33]|uniref:Tad domain-containing protein n=1 Tax=Sinomonas terricola TaxID=3110330 RepID=A0ABU5T196_9MICC|nr:Tad domain-containing protein [Sinomonas sp. JGH33]MEA5453424.1 Tad domain-containing protein [Sinomonas sp. JGH33]